MTAIKLDKVQYSNLVDTYINYETSTSDINISGSVANGATATFTAVIPYSRAKTRADVYLKNKTTNKKMPTNMGVRINPYTPASTETCSHTVSYDGSNITVTIDIFNGTGAGITLTTQTLEAQAVAYYVPYNQ